MKRHSPQLRQQQGIGLIGAMIAVGVAGLMVAGISQLLDNRAEQNEINRLREAREKVAQRVLRMMSSPSTLYWSSRSSTGCPSPNAAPQACQNAHKNKLGRCLGTAGNGNCQGGDDDWSDNDWEEFEAYANFAGGGGGTRIAGTNSDPVHYSIEGLRGCPGVPSSEIPSTKCPFEVISEFKATCQKEASTCSGSEGAAKIRVRAEVRQASGVGSISPVVPDYELSARTYSRISGERPVHLVSAIKDHKVQICPPGSRQTGVYDNGLIKCECLGRFPQIDFDPVLKQPVCDIEADQSCPDDEVARGIDTDGSIICGAINDGWSCKTEPVNNQGEGQCGDPDYRIREFTDPNNCYVLQEGADNDDAGDWPVICPGQTVTCCKPEFNQMN